MRSTPSYRLFIGFDAAEMTAWNVARMSALRTTSVPLDIHRLSMAFLRAQGLYTRPTQHTEHGYWDELSNAPMSTGHAIARFLVPHLCGYDGLALFTDGDVLFRSDVARLFALADPRYAVQVVKHQYVPTETTKMAGQIQTQYFRKNWSSVVLWNAGHPVNKHVTKELVNTRPGRDLHRFCWLEDELIGTLSAEWNFLIGHTDPSIDPAIAHFTEGIPDHPGYEHCAFSDEWYLMAKTCGYRLSRPIRPEAMSA